MYKKWYISTFTGIAFTSVIGTLFHFVYQWSGQNSIVGLFTPINESTWEHMKLLFFPMLLYVLIESFFLPYTASVAAASGAGLIFGTFSIPVLFYTYSGILGFNLPILDISTFFISVITAFFLRYKGIVSGKYENFLYLLIFINLLIMMAFMIFTYTPPDIALFRSPM